MQEKKREKGILLGKHLGNVNVFDETTREINLLSIVLFFFIPFTNKIPVFARVAVEIWQVEYALEMEVELVN